MDGLGRPRCSHGAPCPPNQGSISKMGQNGAVRLSTSFSEPAAERHDAVDATAGHRASEQASTQTTYYSHHLAPPPRPRPH